MGSDPRCDARYSPIDDYIPGQKFCGDPRDKSSATSATLDGWRWITRGLPNAIERNQPVRETPRDSRVRNGERGAKDSRQNSAVRRRIRERTRRAVRDVSTASSRHVPRHRSSRKSIPHYRDEFSVGVARARRISTRYRLHGESSSNFSRYSK